MNTVSATSVPLFASLAMRANVAVAVSADVDVAAAFAKAAHTLNIFNCCWCCCCCCDAALFKLDVDHSCVLCFILFDTCTRVVRTYIYTCEYECVCVCVGVCIYLQWRMFDCTHVNNRISKSVSLANRQHYCLFTFISSVCLCLSPLSARLLFYSV